MKTVAESLNCPNCGAAVASDKTQCEFCKSRLKTVGCASCLGLMFLGSKFCSHCGAKSVAVELTDSANIAECPRCKEHLQALKIETTDLLECNRCGGLWTGTETFETICTDRERQSTVLTFFKSSTRPDKNPTAISYVPCPVCKQLMNRGNFARSSGVIIDICKAHGVWFDTEELPKIINFINNGGLSHAREKERLYIEDERRKLRDDQRRQAALDQRFGTGNDWKDDSSSTVGRIVRLFLD